MNYLTGYTIKPYEITPTGRVIFTDGTATNIIPNQIQCEAYGYTYDPASGTCQSFNYNPILDINLGNINNKFNGVGNTAATGTNHIQINGTNNTVNEGALNCFISGSNNTIENGIKDATIVGSNGTAIRDGEFIVGTAAGQTSTFALSGTTTDATSTALFVNGDTDVTTIAREVDKIYYFTINVFAFRTGGSSGSGATGDRAFIQIHGMISDTTITQGTTTLVAFGTTVGWTASCVTVGDNLQLKVVGAASMNILWEAKAEFSKLIGI
jgi:hypothetical protein